MDIMNNLSWFYPETETECLDLLKNGYRPHAGGTFLVKTSLNIKGLFDLSSVRSLKKSEKQNGYLHIGASVTYAEAAAFLDKEAPGSLLSSALNSAAATPLRNRISIGGSICAAPKWSDIIAPLYACDALIAIAGQKETVSVDAFMPDRNLKKSSLVTSVILPENSLTGFYYRFTITGFDYPLFSIAVSVRGPESFRCAVSGCSGGVRVFNGNIETIAAEAEKELSFNDERGLSGGYIKNRALTELKRLPGTGGTANE